MGKAEETQASKMACEVAIRDAIAKFHEDTGLPLKIQVSEYFRRSSDGAVRSAIVEIIL